jgi:hypothetical protein
VPVRTTVQVRRKRKAIALLNSETQLQMHPVNKLYFLHILLISLNYFIIKY